MRADALQVSAIGTPIAGPLATRAEWADAGAGWRMFQDGRLHQVAHGLFCPPELAADPQALARALMERCPVDAVLGGWAAAYVHGARDAGPTMVTRTPQRVLVYYGRHEHKRPPGFTVRRSDLSVSETIQLGGLLLTSGPRTAYDMARFADSLPQAVGILDCFCSELNTEPVELAAISELLATHPRYRGNPTVRAAIDLASSRARSFAESTVRARWTIDAGVPADSLLVNATLRFAGAEFELDLVDLSAGLVIEYDGPHHASSDQRSRDAAKDFAATALGLARTRLNARELRLTRAGFERLAADRRTVAISAGAPARAAALVASGELAERPLKSFTRGGFTTDNEPRAV
ncbi:hypothetical protein EK0264_04460 [Epidermidibacterium keratini]|uniref:DUF559 domain-containing protein n=1 Tax=Epidermidibacterium keratini TaxID=1891644 RepID=A0A7L4YK24_9ACTN|nr:hypothetical protein [Epidermidibacterium keratini]QHB99610.1 hypothetical protein EK0264_04460 [Epidermidibacterium keratini]